MGNPITPGQMTGNSGTAGALTYSSSIIPAYKNALFPKGGGGVSPNFNSTGNGMPTILARCGKRAVAMPIGTGIASVGSITNGGTGYATNDLITVTPSNGTGTPGTLKVTGQSGGVVSSLAVVNPGAGFTSGFSLSGGSGSSLAVTLSFQGLGYPIP